MNTKLASILASAFLAVFGLTFGIAGHAAGGIENPAQSSTQSGIGLISGWYCPSAAMTYSIDGGAPQSIPAGGPRGDTASVCNGATNTGFGLLVNFNNLPPGQHAVRVYADGVQVDEKTFLTTNLGSEFLTGKQGQYYLNNFPAAGRRTLVQWQQEKQNFSIIGSDDDLPALVGTYFGAMTYRITDCGTSNGNYAEPASFVVSQTGAATTVQAQYLAGGSCSYVGQLYYNYDGGELSVPSGTFSCTDGTSGSYSASRITVTASGVILDFAQSFANGCKVQGRLGGPRA